MSTTSPTGSSQGVEQYRYFEAQRDKVYQFLSFQEAVAARGVGGFSLIVLAFGALFWEIAKIAPIAFGQTAAMISMSAMAAPNAPTPFTPPFGLPQSVFTVIICFAMIMALCILVALTYAGYFASPKSTKAATIVEHFATLVFGFIFGKHM